MNYNAKDVICPFYSDDTRNSIKCEGLFSTSSTQNFKTSAERNRHIQRYCNTFNYKKCPYAEAMLLKYKDG